MYGYVYDDRKQLEQVTTPEGDIRVYGYDDAGNRKTRSAIIGGKEFDRHEIIEIDVLVEMILEKMAEDEEKGEKEEKEDKSKGNDNKPDKKDNVKSGSSYTPIVYSAAKDKEDKNNGNNNDNDKGNNDKGNGSDNNNNGKGNDKSDAKGNENAVNRGNGKKIGLLKKLGIYEDEKKTGQVENILAVIDQIVNGEVNLPSGEHEELFALVREVGKGYTVLGTTWNYNEKNEITHRENHIRFEEYDYVHDDAGNMTTNERSQYTWNAKGLLETVTFPDGSGQEYQYDARGRRTKTIQFNHQENTQWEINHHYKGDSWNIDRETDGEGNIIKEFTYDEKNKPLSITYKGETFWYVYNGHGDVIALTDINGEVAARYEYDEWGLPTKMYNRYGERIREGTGWIGDLNTGNGTPGSKNEETDKDEIDQHPGNGNTKNADKNVNKKNNSDEEIIATDENAGITEENVEELAQETTIEEISVEEVATEVLAEEVTADITTDLVKENPYRYSGYYFDRKTQFYYLQARYYDARIGRFISMDPLRGEITNPLSLNRYVYSLNNPVNYIDPTGEAAEAVGGGGNSTGYGYKTFVISSTYKLEKHFSTLPYEEDKLPNKNKYKKTYDKGRIILMEYNNKGKPINYWVLAGQVGTDVLGGHHDKIYIRIPNGDGGHYKNFYTIDLDYYVNSVTKDIFENKKDYLYYDNSKHKFISHTLWEDIVHIEERSLLNSDATLPSSPKKANEEDFDELPWHLAIYHGSMMDKNRKFVHPNGREAIYTQTGKLLPLEENPKIGPTFNYVVPTGTESTNTGHYLFDMVPYFWWDNI